MTIRPSTVRAGNVVKIVREESFTPEQLQGFIAFSETPDDYAKRGGVAHFSGKDSKGYTICGGSIGVSVKQWLRVTCLACFRARAKVRKKNGMSR